MKIHALRGYIQNIFLVEYAHGLLLLDGCGRADVDMVCKFIQHQLNRQLRDLKLIVVTHMHPDHAGGAHTLRKRTGATIAAHPKAKRWYSGLVGRVAHATDVVLALWVAGRIGKPSKFIWYNPILAPDLELEDAQALPDFPEWQALYTPGHTDHDLSLWHADSKQIYVADLVVRVKRKLVPPFPLCHPNQYKRSLQKIQLLDSPILMFAHVQSQRFSSNDYFSVLESAPDKPSNIWLATKAKVRRLFLKK